MWYDYHIHVFDIYEKPPSVILFVPITNSVNQYCDTKLRE